MLALMKAGAIVQVVSEGGGFAIGDAYTMPAVAGWQSGDGAYTLVAVADADPVPAGKQVAGSTVQLVNGAPKVVNTLADIPPPDSVSARQFHLQLSAAGLRDQVKGWIAAQSVEVQDAFEYSGSFVRSEPMMEQGFTALGYSAAQIDAFFTAAAQL